MRGEVPRPTKFNPAITPMLEECVLTALQKDPDKRYNSVSDFISELKMAQGFTTSIYKPAQPEFAAMTKPIAQKTEKIARTETEGKLSHLITNFPQSIFGSPWCFYLFPVFCGHFLALEIFGVPQM